MVNKEKDKINVLMNIDSYFGEHQGRLGPMLTFLCVSATPFIIYVFYLTSIIPLKWILIFEVLFTIRMALLILGKENEKLKVYIKEQEDEFASADDLIRVSHVHEDGLVEYSNGIVCYIISAYTTTYFKDSVLSIDLEEFLNKIKGYEYDIDCHQVVNEHNLQDNLESMSVYADDEMLKERIDFYMLQDDYCNSNTMLYRINIIVKSSKSNWKKLKFDLSAVIHSSYANVFHECYICDREEVSDVMSRDLCMYIDIVDMLQEKYSNEDYRGSKVLFYGEEVPDEYKKKEEAVNLRGRRVIEE